MAGLGVGTSIRNHSELTASMFPLDFAIKGYSEVLTSRKLNNN